MYTHYLEGAPDLGTFTAGGPCCARGLGYVVHDRPDRQKRRYPPPDAA